MKTLGRCKGITEKKMFGGLSFLLNGKMCCGVLKDILVVRINPEQSDKFLKKPHVRPMDFTGRPMKGFLYVSSDGCKTDKQLDSWIEHGFAYAASLTSQKKNRWNESAVFLFSIRRSAGITWVVRSARHADVSQKPDLTWVLLCSPVWYPNLVRSIRVSLGSE